MVYLVYAAADAPAFTAEATSVLTRVNRVTDASNARQVLSNLESMELDATAEQAFIVAAGDRRTTASLIDLAERAQASVQIIHEPGAIDELVDTCSVGSEPFCVDSIDTDMRFIHPTRWNIFRPVAHLERLVDCLNRISRLYPTSHRMSLVPACPMAARPYVITPPWSAIDPALLPCWVVIPPVEAGAGRDMDSAVSVVSRLRAPDGCQWDRKQTHESLRSCLLEEVYEVLEAIDTGDPAALADELGDLLMQVLMHAQIGGELRSFDLIDVTGSLCDKLIRRHPHVFTGLIVNSVEDILHNWEAIKRAERGAAAQTPSATDGVPLSMPALARAQKMSRRVTKLGFEWNTVDDIHLKLEEEIAELREAASSGDASAIEHEVGDVLFTVVNIARRLDVDAEQALRRMVSRFVQRFRTMEEIAACRGICLNQLDSDGWENLWQAAKQQETPPSE